MNTSFLRWTLLAPFVLTVGLVSFSVGEEPPVESEKPGKPRASEGPEGPENEAAFLARFEKEIWPLLRRGEGKDSCLGCHDAESESELRFHSDSRSSFRMLLSRGYFEPENPDSLLARLSSTKKSRRMPRSKRPPWSVEERQLLRTFVNDLHKKRMGADARYDERFPPELLEPYEGPASEGMDNTFLTYRQLKGKVLTIFGDGWVRGGRDRFAENISLFGGADFRKRMNENIKASATFLSALDTMARDVAERAYNRGTGPFAGRAVNLTSPLVSEKPDDACRAEIRRLYRSILFRDPAAGEIERAIRFLQGIYRASDEIERSNYDLTFELAVEDEAGGLKSTREFTIPVSGERLGLSQEYVNQAVEGPKDIVEHKLAGLFTFRPGDQRQRVEVSNAGSHGNVSFHGVEIRREDGQDAGGKPLRWTAVDSRVRVEGAWKLQQSGGFPSYEDGDNSKGDSSIIVPVSVEKEGRHEVTLLWRKNLHNARSVLVEVFSHDAARLAHPEPPSLPPAGEARYSVDQSDDTVAFRDLETYFEFAESDHVEISNRGTRRRVTADAVKFLPRTSGEAILIDNHEAEGRESWKPYKSGQFRAYNQVGQDTYHDENRRKGELQLRYRPSMKKAWRSEEFYRVMVGYPAKRDHETRTPVIVRAKRSSPVIQLVRPARAVAGAIVELDGSATYTVHRGTLRFRWLQVGGPEVTLEAVDDGESDAKGSGPGAVVTFRAPPRSVAQAAWVGLCRALMSHPDFLFTRPPSVATARDAREKRRLQLVKIALDLVGRPPVEAEIDRLGGGASLAAMIDGYLRTEEFKDFYFHRVRLHLESHGTGQQDEPARVWCHVAFNDLPFKEILTAEYTVDEAMRKQSRPEYHGRTGILTTAGFIEGKPGLPHFNYAAQVAEKFLGYVFEVPPEIVKQREAITAISTTNSDTVCYSCHKLLTPLAYQRLRWDDQGRYRTTDSDGEPIDDSDRGLVPSYRFRGDGMEAFATKAVDKERFIRTIINTHFAWYFGREMRHRKDERKLYKELWDSVHAGKFTIRELLKAILLSPEYLEGRPRSGTSPAGKEDVSAILDRVDEP